MIKNLNINFYNLIVLELKKINQIIHIHIMLKKINIIKKIFNKLEFMLYMILWMKRKKLLINLLALINENI